MNIDTKTAGQAGMFQQALADAIQRHEDLIIPANVLKHFKDMFADYVKTYDEAFEDGYNAGAGDEYFNEH